MMEAVRTSETSVHNHFTRQYIPEDKSEVLKGFDDHVLHLRNHVFGLCPSSNLS
jgi:hypothetical protein